MACNFPALVSMCPGARVLVCGGTGLVGSGVVNAMLKQGAKVKVAGRCKDRFKNLCCSVPEKCQQNLSFVAGDVTTPEGVKEIFKEAMKKCPIQHIVASIKPCKSMIQDQESDSCDPCLSAYCGKRFMDQTLEEFYTVLKQEVTAHFLLMKQFLPCLEKCKGSTYTVVTGFPANSCMVPECISPLYYLSTGAVQALANAARVEYHDSRVAVSEFHMKCQVHDRPDAEVCCSGACHLGNDLVGSAITALVASASRRKVIIKTREDANELAKTKRESCEVQDTCSPCSPCPPPPCPTSK